MKSHNKQLNETNQTEGLEYIFDILSNPRGKHETSRTEEFLIRAGGGPIRDNPHVVLENKISGAVDHKYQSFGGDF